MKKTDKSLGMMWKTVLSVRANDKAIYYDEKYYTYRELDEKSWYVANYLKKYVTSNNVGVRMESSFDYVCTVLGVLKAGKCFVPLDIHWPDDRILYVQKNGDLDCIVESGDECLFGKITIEEIYNAKEQGEDREWGIGCSAYIMYSSGTTGRPKGIEIGTEGLINLVEWFGDVFLGTDIERVLQLARISFDVSVEEIFGTILNGKILLIPKPAIRYHKVKLRKFIAEHNVNLIELVPATLKEFFDGEEKIGCLKTIICGADVLHEELKNSIISIGYELYNNYGPTETTVDTMYYRCSLAEPVQLGNCIPGCHYVIIDECGNKVKKGGLGEIWFSGINLAIGYLKEVELNNDRFVDYEGERFYRTGDLVRIDNQNRVFYCGRTDNQVKIRGQRVELEEIERVFADEMEVKICAAICKKQEHEKIVLFYEASEEYEYRMIFDKLRKRLPDYMMPSFFQYMDKLPCTDNGKVDRKALSECNIMQDRKCINYEYDEFTQKIVKIMCEILERDSEEIDLFSNFEQLGFDSLSFVRFLVEIEMCWDIELDDELLILDNKLTVHDMIKNIKNNFGGE